MIVTTSAALAGVQRLYVDTAPFIYFTERTATYLTRMRAVFRYLDEERLTVYTSAIILTELLTKPLGDHDMALAAAHVALLTHTKGVMTVNIDTDIARRAAVLRVQYQLKTPDALHVATALETGCQAFLTNDLGLKRVSEVKMLVLDELT